MVSAAQIARTISNLVTIARNCYGNSYLDGIDAAAAELAAEFEALRQQADALAEALGKLAKSNIKLNDAGDVFCSECSNRYDDPPHLESCPFAALDAYRAAKGASND